MRIVQCISWRRSLGRQQLTTVKLRTCLSFPPRGPCCFYSLVLVLVSCAYAFFWLYEGTKYLAQSKNIDYLYLITIEQTTRRPPVLRTAYICVVLVRVLRTCGHLGLPICVMRECAFLYVLLGAGCLFLMHEVTRWRRR